MRSDTTVISSNRRRWFARMMPPPSPKRGRLSRVIRSNSGAETGWSPGWILKASRYPVAGLRTRRAMRLLNFPVRRKNKENANRLALVIQIVKRGAFGHRRDLLQTERGRREDLETRPPIGRERRSACVEAGAIALTFEAGVVCVELQQRFDIALPARIQPVDDDGYLIEIIRQGHAIHLMRPGSGCRVWQRGM